MPVFLVIALVVAAGGGVSLAAENALPGDALYPIKISFNENVVAAFSVSADAAAQWETRLAERRLEEVARLAAEGKIEADIGVKVREKFEEHAERVRERIAEMETRGNVRNASEIASRFETALKVHEGILERLLAATSSDIALKFNRLKIKIKSELDDTEETRERLEEKVKKENGNPKTKVAAEGKIGAAENVIVSVRAELERNRVELGVESASDIENELKDAEELLLEARAKFDGGVYGEAFVLAQKVLREAQEIRSEIKEELAESREDDGDEEDNNDNDDDDAETATSSASGSAEVEFETDSDDDSRGNGGSGVRGNGKIKLEIGL